MPPPRCPSFRTRTFSWNRARSAARRFGRKPRVCCGSGEGWVRATKQPATIGKEEKKKMSANLAALLAGWVFCGLLPLLVQPLSGRCAVHSHIYPFTSSVQGTSAQTRAYLRCCRRFVFFLFLSQVCCALYVCRTWQPRSLTAVGSRSFPQQLRGAQTSRLQRSTKRAERCSRHRGPSRTMPLDRSGRSTRPTTRSGPRAAWSASSTRAPPATWFAMGFVCLL